MAIKGFYHTGFVVQDLDKMVAFYQDALGLKLMGRLERQGEYIDRAVGFPGAHLKIAFLSFGQGHVLELIQYITPKSRDARPNRNDLGATHVSFQVENIEELLRELSRKGLRLLGSPGYLRQDGKVTRAAVYTQDPEGNWLEFVESFD